MFIVFLFTALAFGGEKVGPDMEIREVWEKCDSRAEMNQIIEDYMAKMDTNKCDDVFEIFKDYADPKEGFLDERAHRDFGETKIVARYFHCNSDRNQVKYYLEKLKEPECNYIRGYQAFPKDK